MKHCTPKHIEINHLSTQNQTGLHCTYKSGIQDAVASKRCYCYHAMPSYKIFASSVQNCQQKIELLVQNCTSVIHSSNCGNKAHIAEVNQPCFLKFASSSSPIFLIYLIHFAKALSYLQYSTLQEHAADALTQPCHGEPPNTAVGGSGGASSW